MEERAFQKACIPRDERVGGEQTGRKINVRKVISLKLYTVNGINHETSRWQRKCAIPTAVDTVGAGWRLQGWVWDNHKFR